MANASSTLFYGVFVKTGPLCMAGRAWQAIEPDGTGKVNAGALPSEIWSAVKQMAVEVALDDAEHAFIQTYHPPRREDINVREMTDEMYFGGGYHLSEPWDFFHLYECERCSWRFDENGGMHSLLSSSLKRVEKLLNVFGLRLLRRTLVTKEQWAFGDLDADLCNIHLSCDIDFEAPESNGRFVKLPPAAFVLPSDASSRFGALFRVFPSILHPYPSSQLRPPATPSGKKIKSSDEAKDQDSAQGKTEEDCEPAWHLWTDGYVEM
ncbi:hypothetical protein JCM6882_007227 [Rhodosporidiobolus microsporus]